MHIVRREGGACFCIAIQLSQQERRGKVIRQVVGTINIPDGIGASAKPARMVSQRCAAAHNQRVVGHHSGALYLLNAPFSGQLRQFKQDVPQFGMAISPDGRTLVTGTTNGAALLWNLEAGEPIWRLDELIGWVHENRYVRDLSCTERGRYRIEPYCEGEYE